MNRSPGGATWRRRFGRPGRRCLAPFAILSILGAGGALDYVLADILAVYRDGGSDEVMNARLPAGAWIEEAGRCSPGPAC